MSNTLDGTSRVFVELTEAQIKEREEEIERMVRDIAEGFVEEDGDAKDLAIEEFMDAFAVFGNDYAEHRIAQREAQPPAPVSPPAVTDAEVTAGEADSFWLAVTGNQVHSEHHFMPKLRKALSDFLIRRTRSGQRSPSGGSDA
jgi:hypothetical protein